MAEIPRQATTTSARVRAVVSMVGKSYIAKSSNKSAIQNLNLQYSFCPMTVHLDAGPRAGNGRFLAADTAPDGAFTREDLSEEQLLFGRAAEEFMRTEVVPRAAEIYAKDWALTRELKIGRAHV